MGTNGKKTSEFWTTIGGSLLINLQSMGVIPSEVPIEPETGIWGTVAMFSAYAISRGLRKIKL